VRSRLPLRKQAARTSTGRRTAAARARPPAAWAGPGSRCSAPRAQLAAEVFEDKVPAAGDDALVAGPAAPAAAAPAAADVPASPRGAVAELELPAVLRSRWALRITLTLNL